MKKIFTFMAAAVIALTASAKEYTDQLAITLNGSAPIVSEAKITVTPVEGKENTYDIVLNDFNFSGMPIGDVTITGVTGTTTSTAGGYTFFNEVKEQEATITGESPIAAMLGNKVNVSIKPGSWMNENELHMVINLPVVIPQLGQDFDVVAMFGSHGYQIPNSGFEEFHTETATAISFPTFKPTESSSDEPNSWHSFMSATGDMKGFVCGTPQTSISDDIRPGSEGTKSVKLISALAMGAIPANGTITTGQMQAASADATSTDNCAFLDFMNDAVDGNGDPFYTVMTGTPDAISMWVKFKQGTIKVPEANDITAKAILVTISTNALPGVGSSDAANPDEMYVDDIELVYNAGLSKLAYNGTEISLEEGKYEYNVEDLAAKEVTADQIEAVSDGRGAYVATDVTKAPNGYKANIIVNSNDFKTTNTYTLYINTVSTGINEVETAEDNAAEAIYTIGGQRVNELQKGVNIVRKADGTTVKVLKK